MREIELLLLLLALATVLTEVADRIRVAYPILLMLSGIGMAFVPGLPPVEMNPELVFLVFLPPLLYAAAWNTSWTEFKAAIRPISQLALGCVLFTTTLVAWAAHRFVPGFDWATAFVLGAIVSPPDAVAAAAATKGLGVHRRVITVLEGESLVNDATGLLAYRYAVAAVLTGQFVVWQAAGQFFVVAGGGVLLGLAVGYALRWVHRITPNNTVTETSLTLLTPYVAYLLGEELHVSGVLAVVAAGLYLTWHSTELFSHQSRLQTVAVWNTIVFLFNGLVFILIGLQLPAILAGLRQFSPVTLLGYGALISAVVIAGRLVWVYPNAYAPRWLSRRIREREPDTTVQLVTVTAWTGMRGVVSLAAALALPLTLRPGVPFPQRDLILFLTFSVIFATLVLQGLSLRPLIRWLGIRPDTREQDEEHAVRLQLAFRAIEYLEANYSFGEVPEPVLNQLKTKYEIRVQQLYRQAGTRQEAAKLDDEAVTSFYDAQCELIRLERGEVDRLRLDGRLSEEVHRKIEYELDLEEAQLSQVQWTPGK